MDSSETPLAPSPPRPAMHSLSDFWQGGIKFTPSQSIQPKEWDFRISTNLKRPTGSYFCRSRSVPEAMELEPE